MKNKTTYHDTKAFSTLLCLLAALSMQAQVFSDYFEDKTLRIDYLFTGNATKQEVCLDALSALPVWAGRKHHWQNYPCKGTDKL